MKQKGVRSMIQHLTQQYHDGPVRGYWQGSFYGKSIKFRDTAFQHQFTQAEAEALLAGKTITIQGHKQDAQGKQITYDVTGHLQHGEYHGYDVYHFVSQRNAAYVANNAPVEVQQTLIARIKHWFRRHEV